MKTVSYKWETGNRAGSLAMLVALIWIIPAVAWILFWQWAGVIKGKA